MPGVAVLRGKLPEESEVVVGKFAIYMAYALVSSFQMGENLRIRPPYTRRKLKGVRERGVRKHFLSKRIFP